MRSGVTKQHQKNIIVCMLHECPELVEVLLEGLDDPSRNSKGAQDMMQECINEWRDGKACQCGQCKE